MAADTELDRNEAATPHKLSEARKKGQVAKSADVVSAVVFAAAVAYFYAQGWETVRAQFLFDRHVFTQAADLGATPAALWHLIGTAVRESMLLLAPFLATVVLAAPGGEHRPDRRPVPARIRSRPTGIASTPRTA